MQFDLKLFSGDIEIMTLSFPITIFPRKPVNVVRSAFDRISPTHSLTRRVPVQPVEYLYRENLE